MAACASSRGAGGKLPQTGIGEVNAHIVPLKKGFSILLSSSGRSTRNPNSEQPLDNFNTNAFKS
jgi:hypothetical protein